MRGQLALLAVLDGALEDGFGQCRPDPLCDVLTYRGLTAMRDCP